MKERVRSDLTNDNKPKEREKREIENFIGKNQPLVISPSAILQFLSKYNPQDKHFVW